MRFVGAGDGYGNLEIKNGNEICGSVHTTQITHDAPMKRGRTLCCCAVRAINFSTLSTGIRNYPRSLRSYTNGLKSIFGMRGTKPLFRGNSTKI